MARKTTARKGEYLYHPSGLKDADVEWLNRMLAKADLAPYYVRSGVAPPFPRIVKPPRGTNSSGPM